MVRIAVLVSGGGTNLQALIDAERRGEIPNGKITAVISSNPDAYALERAQQAGITGITIARKNFGSAREMTVALVDTLEYLKRGGRISKTAAFAGGVLNIKPVLSVIDGEIHLLGKARGSKMGNNLLVQEIDKAGGIDFSRPVLLGYSGISDALLLKYIEDSRHIWEGKLKEIRYTTVGSVIGTHAGPGAVVVAFFKNQ